MNKTNKQRAMDNVSRGRNLIPNVQPSKLIEAFSIPLK
jgi:hypothetical protein